VAEALDPILTPELDALTRRVLEAACGRDLKLGTAESCTGGLLASLLTDVPGCSHAFERGFVVYSEEAKHDLLGIAMDMLRDGGAVSQPVVLAMARGALARSRADIVLAVTGWAEDMGDPNKPGGLVRRIIARRSWGSSAARPSGWLAWTSPCRCSRSPSLCESQKQGGSVQARRRVLRGRDFWLSRTAWLSRAR
jgi:nicotinamide-nucleotide amidase